MATSSSGNLEIGLENSCWTCGPLEQYSALGDNFAQNVGNLLQKPMGILFASLCSLWIVLAGIKYASGNTDIKTIVKELFYVSITAILLGSQGGNLISYVYRTSISIMGSAAEVAFKAAQPAEQIATSSDYSGLTALAATGEKAVANVFEVALAITQAGSVFNIFNYVYALILVIPFFLLVVSYSAQVVVAIFRAMMVSIFGSFLFTMYAFGWGRGMAMSGAKTLLSSVLVLFASTAALAITLYGVSTIDISPESMTGDKLNEFASLTNPDFLVILFLGWAGTAFMTEGTSIANSIAGTALTNAAAGIMTAGATGTALAAAKAANPFTMGGRYMNAAKGASDQIDGFKKMGGHAKSTAGAVAGGAAALVNKFRNINKPGGGE